MWSTTRPAPAYPAADARILFHVLAIAAPRALAHGGGEDPGAPAAMIPAVRAALASVDPNVPVEFRTMSSLLSGAVADRRFTMCCWCCSVRWPGADRGGDLRRGVVQRGAANSRDRHPDRDRAEPRRVARMVQRQALRGRGGRRRGGNRRSVRAHAGDGFAAVRRGRDRSGVVRCGRGGVAADGVGGELVPGAARDADRSGGGDPGGVRTGHGPWAPCGRLGGRCPG